MAKKVRQGCGIANVICGQFGTNNLTADKIETKVKFALSFAPHFNLMSVLQPFALTEQLHAGA